MCPTWPRGTLADHVSSPCRRKQGSNCINHLQAALSYIAQAYSLSNPSELSPHASSRCRVFGVD